MPRGSKPGERRGGRQRGTPNKKTVLKDAVFSAAASHPNASPLDFMLGLMRDPKVPTDLRIEMAAAAAPFVHPRLKPPRKIRASGFRGNADFTAQRMEAKLNPDGPGAADLMPLDFLLSVMNDPDATPQQRIKAVRVAARYKHALADAGEMPIVIEDKFGFKIDPALARSIRDDEVRNKDLWYSGTVLRDASSPDQAYRREREAMAARSTEYRKALEAVECPAAYTALEADKDRTRVSEFYKRRRRLEKLTREENIEEAHLFARLEVRQARTGSPELSRRVISFGDLFKMYPKKKNSAESTSTPEPDPQ